MVTQRLFISAPTGFHKDAEVPAHQSWSPIRLLRSPVGGRPPETRQQSPVWTAPPSGYRHVLSCVIASCPLVPGG